MDILACILELYPDWQGVVWGNKYEGITPHEHEVRPTPTLAKVKEIWTVISSKNAITARKADINSARAEKLTAGITYTFPDGKTGTIQTRNESDNKNLLGLYTRASNALNTARIFVLRDAENSNHTMTPEEVIKMGNYIFDIQEAINIEVWSKKDKI